LHFAPHEAHGIVAPEDKGKMKMFIAGVVIPYKRRGFDDDIRYGYSVVIIGASAVFLARKS
jgi:hypothetical protein